MGKEIFKENSFSGDWRIFQGFFKRIGAFRLIRSSKEVYLDDNAYRILRLTKKSNAGVMPENIFIKIIEDLKSHPSAEDGVYSLDKNILPQDAVWIRLSIAETTDGYLGFFEDCGEEIRRKAEKTAFSGFLNVFAFTREAEKRFNALREEYKAENSGNLNNVTNIKNTACMVSLSLKNPESNKNNENDINNINIQDNSAMLKEAVETLAAFTSSNVLIGDGDNGGFLMFITEKNMNEISSLFTEIQKSCSFSQIKVNIGYCLYPLNTESFEDMKVFAEFARFEAERKSRTEKNTIFGKAVEFSSLRYNEQKNRLKKAVICTRIIDENLIDYHFQPVISTNDGMVYGYEAFARPVNPDFPLRSSVRYLEPRGFIETAEAQGLLYVLEKLAFENMLGIISRHTENFEGKRLFINNEGKSVLTSADRAEFSERYGGALKKAAVEFKIKESADIPALKTIFETLYGRGADISLDLCCESEEIFDLTEKGIIPSFLKINRVITQKAVFDIKARHFIINMVNFCKKNNIISVISGIETEEQLIFAVKTGADLVQGFFAAQPAYGFSQFAKPVIREIIKQNKKENKYRRIYGFSGNALDIRSVDTEKYTEVAFYGKETILTDSGKGAVNLTLLAVGIEKSVCRLTLNGVRLMCGDRPALTVKENSRLNLDIIGKCFLSPRIRVHASSSLKISGGGELNINGTGTGASGIGCLGGNRDEDYGNIEIDMKGCLDVAANGDFGIGIGGGKNTAGSKIVITNGTVKSSAIGKKAVAVGAAEGFINPVKVIISEKALLDFCASGEQAVGIGTLEGKAEIVSSAVIIGACTGNHAAVIGVPTGGNTTVKIKGGRLTISLEACDGAGIGTFDGSCDVIIKNASLFADIKGERVAAAGDCLGQGLVALKNSHLEIKQIQNPHSVTVGVFKGNVNNENSEVIEV